MSSGRLKANQRAIVAREVNDGIPAWFVANNWGIQTRTALRIAGLTKTEAGERQAARLARIRSEARSR